MISFKEIGMIDHTEFGSVRDFEEQHNFHYKIEMYWGDVLCLLRNGEFLGPFILYAVVLSDNRWIMSFKNERDAVKTRLMIQ